MSDQDAITRCPHCRTQFKVSAGQLAAASGMVRCGACLQVFHGAAQVDAEEPGISEPDSTDQMPNTDALLADLADESPAEPATREPAVYDGQPQQAVSPDDVDTWSAEADQTLEALASRGFRVEGATAEPVTVEQPASPVASVDPLDEDDVEARQDEDGGFYGKDEVVDAGGASDFTVAPEDPLSIVGDLPTAPQASRLPWLLGALALLLVLAWQHAWYERDHWAQNESLRPYYLSVCALAGCQLPAFNDPVRLRINEVLVRTHPQQAQALQIDAIIRNSAAFAQMFPDLDLVFTDVNNKIVAKRTFSPREYLAGELQGAQLIPAKTEVRIALEVLDPGEDAPGYALTLHSPS